MKNTEEKIVNRIDQLIQKGEAAKGHYVPSPPNVIGGGHIDYSVFNAPVLSQNQPGIGIEVIKAYLGAYIINLSLKETILESPKVVSRKFSEQEKRFSEYLFFNPDTIELELIEDKKPGNKTIIDYDNSDNEDLKLISGVCDDIEEAQTDLNDIVWRISYLVEKDCITPCLSHKFLFKDNNVILNLNHPEIKMMVELSKTAPALAGHWAIAMCLIDSSRILSHISPDVREDLLMIDALSKMGLNKNNNHYSEYKKIGEGNEGSFKDFLENSGYFKHKMN